MFEDNHVNLLIKFPTRARPDKFRNQFDKYYNMLSGQTTFRFVISMDIDDPTMNNDDMKWWLSEANGGRKNIHYYYGNSKTKIQAVNADVNRYKNWDILLLASDDMSVQEQGYDKIIYDEMIKYYSDFSGCLHFNDGRAGKALNTLAILGRNLYNQWGYIYHPQYVSLFCDNEFFDVTNGMNKATYIDRVIIKHDWVDYTGKDKLHTRNESYYKSDGAIYNKRKAKGFPRMSV